ncbi:MAG TPA: DUF58 domain-containing protein [Phycisphaerales bacterium]|nr:DUF58 domain-containing protein [Phycisphaerales bacterium]
MRTGIHFKTSGMLYLGFLLFVGVAAMNSQNNLLFWLLGVLTAGLVISMIASTWMLRGIRVRRLDPHHGSVGQPLMVRYEVRNKRKIFPAFDLQINEIAANGPLAWQERMPPTAAWVMHSGPKETVHGEAVFWPTARGEAQFDRLRISTRFPFGILERSMIIRQPQHTLIYPETHPLQHRVLNALVPPTLIGTRVTHHASGHDDYYGLHEYRQGDSLRHISWKRTAQFDKMICVDRTMPMPSRLRVVLDLGFPERSAQSLSDADRDLCEMAISLAASVIRAAHNAGYEIGLDVPGSQMPSTSIRGGHWHEQKLLATLAGIDTALVTPSQAKVMLRDVERAGLLVIHVGDHDPAARREDAVYLHARQLPNLIERKSADAPKASSAFTGASRRARVALP